MNQTLEQVLDELNTVQAFQLHQTYYSSSMYPYAYTLRLPNGTEGQVHTGALYLLDLLRMMDGRATFFEMAKRFEEIVDPDAWLTTPLASSMYSQLLGFEQYGIISVDRVESDSPDSWGNWINTLQSDLIKKIEVIAIEDFEQGVRTPDSDMRGATDGYTILIRYTDPQSENHLMSLIERLSDQQAPSEAEELLSTIRDETESITSGSVTVSPPLFNLRFGDGPDGWQKEVTLTVKYRGNPPFSDEYLYSYLSSYLQSTRLQMDRKFGLNVEFQLLSKVANPV